MLILRGTDGMNPQKGNCWMKDYEHRVSVLRPGPLSAPQKLTHYAGATLKGPAQNSLQSAQLCKQTGAQVLILTIPQTNVPSGIDAQGVK